MSRNEVIIGPPAARPRSRLPAMALIILFLTQSAWTGSGSILTKFENGSETSSLSFNATATNNTTGILVPLNSYALNASLKVSASQSGGGYPLDPAVDIGDDGTVEWRFNGTGYGRLGQQGSFSDGASSATIDMSSPGSNTSLSFLLPEGANPTSASINVTGMPHMYSSPVIDDITYARSALAAAYDTGTETVYVSKGRAGGLAAIGLATGGLYEWDLRTQPAAMPHLAAMHPYLDPVSQRLLVPTLGGGLWVLNVSTNASFTYGPSTSPSMSPNATSAVLDAGTGLLVVGTDKGMYVINMTTNSSVGTFTTISSPSIASNNVRSVALDPSRKWAFAATPNGIAVVNLTGMTSFIYDATTTTPGIAGNNVTHLQYDAATDTLYAACYGGGATAIDLATNTSTNHTATSGVTLPDLRVRSIWYDALDNMMLLGSDIGLFVVDLGLSSEVTYNMFSTPSLPQNQVDDVIYNGVKDIAILSHPDRGLLVLNISASSKRSFPVLSGKGPVLSDYATAAMVMDQAHQRIIVSGANAGTPVEVVNLTSKAIERSYGTSTTPKYYGAYVNTMALDRTRNALYLGSPDLGVTFIDLDDNTTRRYTTATVPALPSNAVRDLLFDEARDIVFIGTDAGVSLLNVSSGTFFGYSTSTSPALPSNNVSSLSFSGDVSWLLVSTFDSGLGVVNISSNVTTVYSTLTSPALNRNELSAAAFDARLGLLVVATRGSGVDIVNISSSTVTNPGVGTFLDPVVLDMVYEPSNGKAYLADVKGLVVFDARTATVDSTITMSTVPRLALNDTVSVIERDPSGTRQALSIFRKGSSSPNPWGVLELLKWAEPPGGMNITIGNGSVPDANISDLSTGKVHVDLTGSVAGFMSRVAAGTENTTNVTDQYGNKLLSVRLNVSLLTGGKVVLSELDIIYEATMSVPDFTQTIRTMVNSSTQNDTDAQGRVRVRINVTCTGPGTVTLKDLKIVLDEPPVVKTQALAGLKVAEDTVVAHLLDLYAVFDDDLTDDANLTYGLQVVNSSNITVMLNDSRYVSVDALTGPGNDNWTGTVTVNVSATDVHNLTAWTGPFTLTIAPVDDVPWFTSQPPTKKAKVGVQYLFNATGDDIDSSTLTFTLADGPSGMALTGAGPRTANISWTPAKGQNGIGNISLALTDGNSTVYQNFSLVVDPPDVQPNRPPRITSTPQPNAYIGAIYRYQVYATDEDGDALTFILGSGPDGMVMGPTGLITWTPRSDQKGSFDVVVRVSDGNGSDVQMFTLTVQEKNFEPTISPIPDIVIYVDEKWSYQVLAEDQNGDTLLFTMFSTPPANGLIIDGKGLLSWTPTEGDTGSYLLEISVSDGTYSVTGTANLEVISMTTPFYRVEFVTPKEGSTVKDRIPVQGRVLSNMADVTKVELMIKASSDTSAGTWVPLTGKATWTYSWDTTASVNGAYKITVRAHNSTGPVTETSVNVTVDNIIPEEEKPETTIMGLAPMMFWGLISMVLIIIFLAVAVIAFVRTRGKQEVQEEEDDYEPMMMQSKMGGKIEVERLLQQQVAAKAEGDVEKELLEKKRKEIRAKGGAESADTDGDASAVGVDEAKEVEKLMEEIEGDLTDKGTAAGGVRPETPPKTKPKAMDDKDKKKAWEAEGKASGDANDVDALLDEIENQ